MLNQTSQEFRALFLLAFTKKLIENSKTEEVFKLEKILKEKQKEKQKIIKEKLTSKKETKPLQKFPEKKPLKIQKTNMILRIPQPRIPPHLRYLQPFATQEIINIETINPLLKDRRVKIIECQGPDEKIIVQTTISRLIAKITEEIEIYKINRDSVEQDMKNH